MRKKLLVAVMSMGLVFGSVMHANAAQCLNVRDYGYHNYDYRVIEGGTAKYVVNSYPETKYYKDKKGRQYRKEGITTVYRVLTYYTHLCVCGSGYSDTDYYDDPVFTPNN